MNRHRDRGTKDRKSATRKAVVKAKAAVKYAETKFGKIPMHLREVENAYGKIMSYYEYDLDFKPPLPPGAVRGDVKRQDFCPLCHTPRYYYEDIERRCVQCETDFIFSAKEQRYWYEGLKFHFDSVAVRCPGCRRQRRSEKALRNQMAATLLRLHENPQDPDALLADAEAIVRYYQRTGEGNLNRAIASSRKAIKFWPKATDAWFWEGLAQHYAGRTGKALELLQAFMHQSSVKHARPRAMVLEARRIVERATSR